MSGAPRDPADAFALGVERLGGQSAAAPVILKSQSSIGRRLKSRRVIWAEAVPAFEQATGISRHDLRPDLYPREVTVPRHGVGLDAIGAAR